MSFVTDGDTEDLGSGYLRRPISVAQLLEREGYRPVVRSRTARRALSGVAAGAVLTLGAVVGSLFLNHGERTTGDVASAGLSQSGGDIVLSESKAPAGSAARAVSTTTAPHTTAQHHPTTPTTKTQPIHHSTPTNHTKTTNQAPATTQPTNTSTTQSTQSAPGLTPNTATTSTTTQATSTAPTSTQTTTQQPTTQQTTTQQTTTQQTTTQQTTTRPTTGQDNGGLLGGVGQVLGSVTQPVFNWFG